MSTLASNHLSSPCLYRANGAFCEGGLLYEAKAVDVTDQLNLVSHGLILLEGIPVQCPACEGKSRILTPEGREMLIFLQTFMRKDISEMIEEILEIKL
jgi:hypothetical protein